MDLILIPIRLFNIAMNNILHVRLYNGCRISDSNRKIEELIEKFTTTHLEIAPGVFSGIERSIPWEDPLTAVSFTTINILILSKPCYLLLS